LFEKKGKMREERGKNNLSDAVSLIHDDMMMMMMMTLFIEQAR
jgi:hypothetical protein